MAERRRRTSGSRPQGQAAAGRGAAGRGGARRSAAGPQQSRTHRVNPARLLAFDVLLAVQSEDAYANLLLPPRLARADLSAADAGLATELTYGTLRGLGLYDAIIEHASGRAVSALDPAPLTALRLGAHQLLGMQVQAHAAVNETVSTMRVRRHMRTAGLVNAVMRRMSERSRSDWLDTLSADLPADEALALRTSHPVWMVEALRASLHAHGRETTELEDLLHADNIPARVCVTALPGLADRDTIAAAHGEPTALSPLGVQLSSGDPLSLTEVRAGTARVQDEGSQLVALALTVPEAPAGPILDMCAGPGGKTAILAAHAAGTGQPVTACDASAHRAELVADSVRAVPAEVRVLTTDARTLDGEHRGAYSRVLVDVPCTGLGALRRRPEARWRRSPGDVDDLAPVQRGLLAQAIRLAAPSGLIAYTTCSPHHAETLDVLRDVLEHAGTAGPEAGASAGTGGADSAGASGTGGADSAGTSGTADPIPAVSVLDAAAVLAEITGRPAGEFASARLGDGRAVQLWPHAHGTDGMFLALLRRTG